MDPEIKTIKNSIRIGNLIMLGVLIFFGFLINGKDWGGLLLIYTIPFSLIIGIYLLVQLHKLRHTGYKDAATSIYYILAVVYILCIPNMIFSTGISILITQISSLLIG